MRKNDPSLENRGVAVKARNTKEKGSNHMSSVQASPGTDTPRPKERHSFQKGKEPKRKTTVSTLGEGTRKRERSVFKEGQKRESERKRGTEER